MSKDDIDDDGLIRVYVNKLGGIIVEKYNDYMEFLPYEAKELEIKLSGAIAELKDTL